MFGGVSFCWQLGYVWFAYVYASCVGCVTRFCCVGVDCLVVVELFACGKVLQGYGVFLLRRVWQEVILRI